MLKGIPRPRIEVDGKSYPLPYTAEDHAIANIADTRMAECVRDCLCIVCGETVEEKRSLALLKYGELMNESGPFHTKCAKMAFFLCPHITDDKYSLVEMDTEDILSFIRSRW